MYIYIYVCIRIYIYRPHVQAWPGGSVGQSEGLLIWARALCPNIQKKVENKGKNRGKREKRVDANYILYVGEGTRTVRACHAQVVSLIPSKPRELKFPWI